MTSAIVFDDCASQCGGSACMEAPADVSLTRENCIVRKHCAKLDLEDAIVNGKNGSWEHQANTAAAQWFKHGFSTESKLKFGSNCTSRPALCTQAKCWRTQRKRLW
jgi:hypothetical protein